MTSLSVNRWDFTDKLLEINNLSGRRRGFTDKITFCETTIIRNSSLGQSPNEEQRLGGLTSRHQTTGQVRVFAAANTWRTQRPRGASGLGGLRQGIIRCRAEAGGQGCLCGDGKPEGPDVPP